VSARESARERAIRRAAAAAGEPEPEPETPDDYVLRRQHEFRGGRVRRVRVPNLAASRGDVIKVGKHRAVILTVEWRDPSWAVTYRTLTAKGTRVSNTDPQITFVKPTEAPVPTGRWNGPLYPGAHGCVDAAVPSDGDGTDTQTRSTNRPTGQKEDGIMPTVVKRSGSKKGAAANKKSGAKSAAKSPAKVAEPAEPAAASNGSTRRTTADLDAMVPKFLKAIKGGATMRAVKQEFGFSDDGPIRAALYRAGYTSKGEEHGEEADSLDASKAAGKKRVLALREEGAGWYRLAYLTGLSEGEVKTLVKEAGGPTGRVYSRTEKPAGKSPAKGASPEADEKASTAARKGSGKKVTRRATKADPSKQG
jgi:hypothetical protein